VSSIRLYILAALEERGEMHGHQLRQLAEQEHVDEWTDITVGALYGALKRIAAEGLIEEVRTEQVGGYPERQIWNITGAGRVALAGLRLGGLREIVDRADPFDLALSRLDPDRLDEVPALLAERVAGLRSMLALAESHHATIDQYLTPVERVVVTHRTTRLRADIAWHDALIEQLAELLVIDPSREDPRP